MGLTPLLTFNKLSFVRDEHPLLLNLSGHYYPGELVHLQGANGSGKTTLLKLVAGFLSPTLGVIERQGTCAYLGHQNALIRSFTVLEHLQQIVAWERAGVSSWSCAPDPAITSLDFWLEHLGLTRVRHHYCHQLSAGQSRRLALARVLISSHPIWLLDEPLTAMDVEGSAWVTQQIADALARRILVVMSSHTSLVGLDASTRYLKITSSHSSPTPSYPFLADALDVASC